MSEQLRLRPYQKEAVDAAVGHFRAGNLPACIVLPTGAGKSLVIAELCRIARGDVLVLAHVKELCAQNFEKYQLLSGRYPLRRAGIFSAGLGQKETGQPVTFGSVQSVARHLDSWATPVSLVIVDECHRMSGEQSTQYARVVEALTRTNEARGAPPPRLLGLTATPYRLGMGWIYERHARGLVRSEQPRPFRDCIYEVPLRTMIEQGYLTPPRLVDAPVAQYDFSALSSHEWGELPKKEVNALLVRHRRVTRAIVEQIVELARDQKRRGVMIFAATVEHAKEIASYLPDDETALILGETENDVRTDRVRRFVEQSVRYLINVAVLTTGFDAPHVDLIAILRPTESVSLFQQIIGRGLRLYPGKQDCLIMDYAGNGFDPFAPEVGEKKPTNDSVVVSVTCPACGAENQFWGQKDESGHVIEHFGRRCAALIETEGGERERCTYRFRFKQCDACGAENDIAARRCGSCARALVDPDDKLKDALRLKDGLVLRVSGMTLTSDGSRLRLTYHDEDGASVRETFDFERPKQRALFNREFSRRIASGRRPLTLESPEQALALQGHLPTPDFVLCRKQKKGRAAFFAVQSRIFDYAGSRRRANEL